MMDFNRHSTAIHLSAILVFIFLISCKTAEKISVDKLRPISAARLFKKAEENTFDYKQFNIKRINIQLDNGKTKTSIRAGLQAIKDESILLSVTRFNIIMGRIMLTPDSIVYVNYLDKVYYAGDYGPVSKKLNIELNFKTLQAIISANIFTLFEEGRELREFQTRIEKGMYVLQSEDIIKLNRMEEQGQSQRAERYLKRLNEVIPVVQTFYFDPELYVIRELKMEGKESIRKAEIRFSEYEQIGGKYYPASVNLVVSLEGGSFTINSKMAGFSTDDGEFVPLKIPDKYQRVFIN